MDGADPSTRSREAARELRRHLARVVVPVAYVRESREPRRGEGPHCAPLPWLWEWVEVDRLLRSRGDAATAIGDVIVPAGLSGAIEADVATAIGGGLNRPPWAIEADAPTWVADALAVLAAERPDVAAVATRLARLFSTTLERLLAHALDWIDRFGPDVESGPGALALAIVSSPRALDGSLSLSTLDGLAQAVALAAGPADDPRHAARCVAAASLLPTWRDTLARLGATVVALDLGDGSRVATAQPASATRP